MRGGGAEKKKSPQVRLLTFITFITFKKKKCTIRLIINRTRK